MPYQPRATLDNPYGPQVTFRTEDVLPPSAYYVSPDDRIVCNVAASKAGLTIMLQIRLLTAFGEVKLMPYTFGQPILNNFLPAFEVPPVEGYILGAMCWAVDPQRGECFLNLSIVRGVPPDMVNAGLVLLQGYTNNMNVLSYPTTPLQPTFDGQGAFLTFTPADTVGANWSMTPAGPTLWRICSLAFFLGTSGAGTTRVAAVEVVDPAGARVGFWCSNVLQNPGTGMFYSFSPGAALTTAGNSATVPLAAPLYLKPGWIIRSDIQNLDAGDGMSSIHIAVESWMGE